MSEKFLLTVEVNFKENAENHVIVAIAQRPNDVKSIIYHNRDKLHTPADLQQQTTFLIDFPRDKKMELEVIKGKIPCTDTKSKNVTNPFGLFKLISQLVLFSHCLFPIVCEFENDMAVVCNLGLSAELGFRQNSRYYWCLWPQTEQLKGFCFKKSNFKVWVPDVDSHFLIIIIFFTLSNWTRGEAPMVWAGR